MAGPDDDSAASPPPRGSILRGIDFESMAEAIPHIVWLAGPDGLIEYVNSHAVDYAGVGELRLRRHDDGHRQVQGGLSVTREKLDT